MQKPNKRRYKFYKYTLNGINYRYLAYKGDHCDILDKITYNKNIKAYITYNEKYKSLNDIKRHSLKYFECQIKNRYAKI